MTYDVRSTSKFGIDLRARQRRRDLAASRSGAVRDRSPVHHSRGRRRPDYTRRSEPAQTVQILAGLRATPAGKRASMSTGPQGLDPRSRLAEIVFEADVSLVTPFLKLTRQSIGDGHMTFACDEGADLGGLGSAPTPLMYFSAALAF